LIILGSLIWLSCSNTTGTPSNAAAPVSPASLDTGNSPAPEGVESRLWEDLNAELHRILAESCTIRTSAGIPRDPASRVNDFDLEPEGQSDITATWTFKNNGDYNQDGEVNASDLTPIGQNWDARLGDTNWTRAKCADGDNDGRITVADITPIGQRWLNTISGYWLQTSATPGIEDSWSDYLQVETGSGDIPPTGGKRTFALHCSATDGSYYRVIPYCGSERGLSSDYVQYTSPVPNQVTGAKASRGKFIGRIVVSWDPGTAGTAFRVERSDAAGGLFSEVGQTAEGVCTYTDTPPVNEARYRYRIIAERNGQQAEPSAEAEGWTASRNWSHTWGCSSRDVANNISLDESGNAFVTGNMYVDDSNQWHGTVIKYLENGDVGWVRQLEGDGNDELYDILAHPSGSVFTGGITTQHEASGYIGLIARCDQEGDFDRHILLDGTKRSSVKALALAPDGNILVLGKIALEGYDDDLLLAKVDTDLNVIWSKTWSWYDDQVGNELVVAPDGSIYAAGYYYDNNNTIRGIILKFSATGELLAQKSYTGGGSPRINGLAVDGLGERVRRRGVARLVAAHAGVSLAGLDVDRRAHRLHGLSLGVQRLHEERYSRGNLEEGRPVLLDRHRAEHELAGVVSGDADRRVVHRGVGFGRNSHQPEPLDGSRGDLLESLLHVQ